MLKSIQLKNSYLSLYFTFSKGDARALANKIKHYTQVKKLLAQYQLLSPNLFTANSSLFKLEIENLVERL